MVEARMIRAYADGDNDVQAIELATEKLRRDIANGVVTLAYGNYSSSLNDDGSPGGGIYGGFSNYMLYYLTGNQELMEMRFVNQSSLEKIYEEYKTGDYAGYVYLGQSEDVEVLTTTGEVFSWHQGDNHAFALTGMTENTITIVNPWNSEKEYEFTWEEFLNLKSEMGITSTKEGVSCDNIEYKLNNGYFDKNTGGKELKSYLITYFNKLWTDVKKDLQGSYYLESVLKNFIKDEFIYGRYDDNTEYNIKATLNSFKNTFEEFINSFENHRLDEYRISASEDNNDNIINKIVNHIISTTYNNHRNSIGSRFDKNQFREQLIQHISNKYGKVDEYNQTGSINLTETIQDTNGDNSWLDEFYQIVNNFSEIISADFYLNNIENRLKNGEFDAINSGDYSFNYYLNNYGNYLINNLRANYYSNDCYDNEEFIRFITDYLNNEILPDVKNNNTNLKDALISLKNTFNEIMNYDLNEYRISISGNNDNSSITKFVNYIISVTYYNNKDNISSTNLTQYRKQLIQYLAKQYGKTDELNQTGSINLAEIIQDSDGDNSWLDEFYNIVQSFKPTAEESTGEKNTVDYNTKIEINGKEYSINDILSSLKPIMYNVDLSGESLTSVLDEILNQLKAALHNFENRISTKIISVIRNYYSQFIQACFNDNAYNNGTNLSIYNNFTKGTDTVYFDSNVAESYGITKTDEYVSIDVRILIQKMLEWANYAANM